MYSTAVLALGKIFSHADVPAQWIGSIGTGGSIRPNRVLGGVQYRANPRISQSSGFKVDLKNRENGFSRLSKF